MVQHSTRNPTTEGLNPASVTKREKMAGKVESLPFLKVHLHLSSLKPLLRLVWAAKFHGMVKGIDRDTSICPWKKSL